MTNYFQKLGVCFFVCTLAVLTPRVVSAQTEKLGIVKYTAPSGWTKTQQQANVIVFSTENQTTGDFGLITLHGAAPGTGNPQTDFAREWKSLVMQNMKAEANPSVATQSEDGWTGIGGGGETEVGGRKAIVFLTVVSGFGQFVSILGVTSDPAHIPKLQAFIDTIKMDNAIAPAISATAPSAPTLDSDGNLVIPEPTRQLTIGDLVGAWGDNPGRIATTYVNRSDGSYAGTDSLHFTSTWAIGANGTYTNDFFEVRNGKKLRDITIGTITITGRLISIKHKGTAKYVVRGWLELPNMTILKVAGPWYDNQEIPERIFTDFSPDSRFILTTKWVRKK